jgi:hypothetical protein
MHDGQLFPLQDLVRLNARVIRPGANGIEFDVVGPVAQGGAPVTGAFVGQRDVVMRVAVLGNQSEV